MARNLFAIAAVVLAASALISEASPVQDSWNWDTFLNTENVFHTKLTSFLGTSNFKASPDLLQLLNGVLAQDAVAQSLYNTYLGRFKKAEMSKAEFTTRLETFKKSMLKVTAHNLEAREGLHSWEMGINQFADMTFDEFRDQYAMKDMPLEGAPGAPVDLASLPTAVDHAHFTSGNLTDYYLDYREYGVITRVKNQLQCNSCTSFATSAQTESTYALFHKQNPWDLSAQQILDCSYPGQDICSHGMWPEAAYQLLQREAAVSWDNYRYEGRNGQCRSQWYQNTGIKVQQFWAINKNENDLLNSVYNYGPAYVCINLCEPLNYYANGVFDTPCSGGGQHSVLVMGYGTENGKDYWLIKNSWDTTFGRQGYLYLRRNYNNQNNILDHPMAIST